MADFDVLALEEFYKEISDPHGMEIQAFQAKLSELFKRDRSEQDLNDFRLSRKKWKKLADEVSPVSRYFKYRGVVTGRVRFQLNSQFPDCLYKANANGNAEEGLEVTIAKGRERYNLKNEMIQKGIGRGFIGVSDDAPQQDFDKVMAKERVMYAPDHALSSTKGGILRCIKEKNDPKFSGCTLIIEAHLNVLPFERWDLIKDDLRQAASVLSFNEVHVIGDSEAEPQGFRIK